MQTRNQQVSGDNPTEQGLKLEDSDYLSARLRGLRG